MTTYQLDYVVEEVTKSAPSEAQIFLKEHWNRKFDAAEAKFLFDRIADHKWYVSERLQRDIGMRVAAIDFLENVYEPSASKPKRRGFIASTLRSYFISKSAILTQ